MQDSSPAAPPVVMTYPVFVSITASYEHSVCAAVGGRKHHLTLCVFKSVYITRMSAMCLTNSPEDSVPLTPTKPSERSYAEALCVPPLVLTRNQGFNLICKCVCE